MKEYIIYFFEISGSIWMLFYIFKYYKKGEVIFNSKSYSGKAAKKILIIMFVMIFLFLLLFIFDFIVYLNNNNI